VYDCVLRRSGWEDTDKGHLRDWIFRTHRQRELAVGFAFGSTSMIVGGNGRMESSGYGANLDFT